MIYNSIDNRRTKDYIRYRHKPKSKLKERVNKMSAKEIAAIKREFGKVTYKMLMKLNYERNHDVSEERFILQRIPICN